MTRIEMNHNEKLSWFEESLELVREEFKEQMKNKVFNFSDNVSEATKKFILKDSSYSVSIEPHVHVCFNYINQIRCVLVGVTTDDKYKLFIAKYYV